MNSEEIKNKIQVILQDRFAEFQKHQIKEGYNSLRFACPYCGDSTQHLHKKRGNVYLNTGTFYCYNCSKYTPLHQFFKSFNVNLKIKDIVYFKKLLVKKAQEEFQIGTEFEDILKYAVNFKEFIKDNKIHRCKKTHPFIQKRLIQHRYKYVGWKDNDIYLFNVFNGKLLGFQIKKYWKSPTSFYSKVTIKDMYEKDEWKTRKTIKDISILNKYTKISLMYGLLNLNFNQKITVLEGVIDSWFISNSVATSSVNISLDFLSNHPDTRRLFDNDAIGKKKMLEAINEGKEVFLWDKFIEDNNIKQTTKIIKDINDLVIYLKKHKKLKLLRKLDNYFSSDILDIIHV